MKITLDCFYQKHKGLILYKDIKGHQIISTSLDFNLQIRLYIRVTVSYRFLDVLPCLK